MSRLIALVLLTAGIIPAQVVLTGLSPMVGPFMVGAGGCLTITATVTGATTSGMTATAAATTDPGTTNGVYWTAFVSAANTVTVKICRPTAGNIGGSTYRVNVLTGASGGSGTVTGVTATAPLTSSGGTAPNINAVYQGNGGLVQASTGATVTNDCVKFDLNGNTVDSGAPCGVGTVTGVTATAPLTSSGGTTPVISATYQGNGAKVQASTGSTTTGDCVKFDSNGNTVDANQPCGLFSAATFALLGSTMSTGTTTWLTAPAGTPHAYFFTVSAYCTTSSAGATFTMTISWTDPSGTAVSQTTSAATCTTLGTASHTQNSQQIQVQGGTIISYATTAVNTPTADILGNLILLQ